MSKPPTTRQTRSQTKAAQELARHNLQTEDVLDDAASLPFEASTVDTQGGENLDCGNCIRPNNAEMFMVQCERCMLFFHFSCAGVTTATVNLNPFLCKTCVPLGRLKKHLSVRSVATSSIRSSQLSLELQRVEEELHLEEQISQQLERKKQLIAKRYDLLNQKSDTQSRSSGRSNRTTSDRVRDWIVTQGKAENPGPGTDKPMTDPVDSVNQLSGNPVDQLKAGLTSTPVNKDKSMRDPAKSVVESGVPPISEPGELVAQAQPNVHPVDVQSILGLLQNLPTKPIPSGAIGKLFNPMSAYEAWLEKSKRTANVPIKKPESTEQQKRELLLAEKLRQLEEQRQQEQALQRDREEQLKKQLQQAEKEKQELLRQQERVIADNEDHQKRFEEFQAELMNQFKGMLIQQQENQRPRETEVNWYQDELLRLQRSREDNAQRELPPSPIGALSNLPSISEINVGSPYGGRTESSRQLRPPPRAEIERTSICQQRTEQLSLRPGTHPLTSTPQATVVQPQLTPLLTPHQLAARQVVSKELPIFTGKYTEWPRFISSYNHSTQTCGYSDSENLLRLQRAIQDPARTLIDSLLLYPHTVPEAISSLKLLYGRPEQIIQNMIDKVRATPAPEVDLRAFGGYMSQIANATSGVIIRTAAPNAAREERAKLKEKAYVNAHTEYEEGSTDCEATEQPKERLKVVSKVDSGKVCPVCDAEGHLVRDCTKFKILCLDDRWKLVKEKRLCRRCLISHSRWPCKADVCGVNGCQKRHHRLLHYDQPPEDPKKNEPVNAMVTIHRHPATSTLFRMLPVTLYGRQGKINTFAFLDDGSSVTLVQKSIADQLGLVGEDTSLCIHWTSGIKKNISNTQLVDLEISGVNNTKRFKATSVYTVDELGLPGQSMNFEELEVKFDYLRRLPIQSMQSAVPGMLIGLSNLHLMAPLKLREGREGEPIATKTRLGWTIYGTIPGGETPFLHRQMHINGSLPFEDLHEYVRSFFAAESLGVVTPVSAESLDDQRANKILRETTVRTASGRFETGLLWKQDYIEFPDSRPMARKRWKCLENRLLRDPALYENVRNQISDFQQKGFAHKATFEELKHFDPRRTWYLPLGLVVNPKKPGKIRLIWDAAAKVDGVSLNSMLLKGPDLLTPLLSVLFKFRERQVAIGGDIEAMFHQVQIRREDRCAQLFYWRDSPEKPLDTMVTDVAIFGASCSPVHSQYVKNLNATQHEDEYPKAADAIRTKHYVDDYLDSVDTVEEAARLALEVAEVHAKAGFHIRNWVSSDHFVLQKIGAVNPTTVKRFVMDKDCGFERLLGMVWLPDEDVFTFRLNFREDHVKLLSGEDVPSKQQLLSVVMSIYDPTGYLAAFIIHGKIIIQDVWRSPVDWKDKIPNDLHSRWKQWIALLPKIEALKIPRCYFPDYHPDSLRSLELHMFVDASEQAYATVAHFRLVDRGRVRCAFVASKTKVAPLTPLSIPRLEVNAAVLGVRLRKSIVTGHALPITRTRFWTDSKTVLQWVRSKDLRRYRPYVAFRVNEILSLSTAEEWGYFPSRLNVADLATKWGKHGPPLDFDCTFFQSQKFVYDDPSEWPEPCEEVVDLAPEELRSAFVFSHFVLKPVAEWKRFSKWERLLRTMAYVHRYIARKLKREKQPWPINLTREELQKAEGSLWRIAQSDAYPDEVATLCKNQQVSVEQHEPLERSSKIVKLCPMLDEKGVLRVTGRIQAAEFATYDAKHPIILPRNHHVTKLLLDSYHRRFQHANNETVVNEVRQKFSIPKLRVLVRLITTDCEWCKVYKSVPIVPRMAPLPQARLSPFVRPFTFTGVDYFGPYLIKVGRSAAKRWVALFTCLTIRAVHLEIVASLSTESLKKAVRRFIARRGAPQEIYSDRGTNFQGASGELAKEITKNINKELSSTFTDAHTQWRFNPPATPHMGGSWERMVRSVKVALGAIPVERKLDEESLVTMLTEAEHMVNSRPLTFVPLDSADQESLTPNHFLLMSSSGVKQPVKDPVCKGEAVRNSWSLIQNALDSFWQRWVREYMPTLSRRTKWFEETRPIKEGDLVVVVDEGTRNRWQRGRVLRTHPGKDGRVRRVDVQTADGILPSRAVARLALLDVAVGDAEETLQATRGGEC